jgi:hypothetical protein
MSLKCAVAIVDFKRWFPPGDPLSAKMARVCILREDLLLEMNGVLLEDIAELDKPSASFRKTYFLRNMIRTQIEVASGLERLFADASFKNMLDKENGATKKKFDDAKAVIAAVKPMAKDVRNDICGHVLENAVQTGLEDLHYGSFGLMEVGKNAGLTHCTFAGELVSEILLKGVTREQRTKLESEKFKQLATLLQLFSLIDICFEIYLRHKRLV